MAARVVSLVAMAAATGGFASFASAAGLAATYLRTEWVDTPLSVCSADPQFTWTVTATAPGAQLVQTGFQLQVATDAAFTALACDTGIVNSSAPLAHCGNASYLSPNVLFFWRVAVLSNTDVPPYSPVFTASSVFGSGLLPADMTSPWVQSGNASAISRPLRMRANATSSVATAALLRSGSVTRAFAFVAALSYYQLSINGVRVDGQRFAPWTEFTERVVYNTWNVTDAVAAAGSGALILGARVGPGPWAHYAKGYDAKALGLWLELHVDVALSPAHAMRTGCASMRIIMHAAGATERVLPSCTLRAPLTWLAAEDSITASDWYNGEVVDARLEASFDGWDTPSYMPTAPLWRDTVAGPWNTSILSPLVQPPVVQLQTLAPVSLNQAEPGLWVYSFDQNFVGGVQLTVRGAAAGDVITLYAGELLFPNGTVYNQLNGSTLEAVSYTARGLSVETVSPTFAFWGFQYLQVTWPVGLAAPTLADVNGYVVGTGFATASSLQFNGVAPSSSIAARVASTGVASDADILAGVQHLTLWSQRGNFIGIPSDCPTREKRGWSGDASVSSLQASWNFDVAAAYRQWSRTIGDTQTLWASLEPSKAGDVAIFNPSQGPGDLGRSSDASWGTVAVTIPYAVYRQYGDVDVILQTYDSMQSYLSYLISQISNTTQVMSSEALFGDWCAQWNRTLYVPNTAPICATGTFALAATLLAEMADAINKTGDASALRALVAAMGTPFHAFYFNSSTQTYVDDLEQTPQVMALVNDFVPASVRPSLEAWLIHDLETTQGHITTGAVGTRYILEILTDMGRVDLAAVLAATSTFPSWGWWVTQGATTAWECWSGVADATHPPPPTHNHIFLASHGGWIHESLLGLTQQAGSVGFSSPIVHPPILGGAIDLPSMAGNISTVRGDVSVAWTSSSAGTSVFASLPLTIPATFVDVPIAGMSNVSVCDTLSGACVWQNGVFTPGPGITAGVALPGAPYLRFTVFTGAYNLSATSTSMATPASQETCAPVNAGRIATSCGAASVVHAVRASMRVEGDQRAHTYLLTHAVEALCPVGVQSCAVAASAVAARVGSVSWAQLAQEAGAASSAAATELCVVVTCGDDVWVSRAATVVA